jgi:transposase-like protein
VAAREKAIRVIEKLRGLHLTKAAEAGVETLTYYAFPEQYWRRIRTNNPLERLPLEIRRRTRVVGAFPTANRPSTSPRPGYGTSPVQHDRPNDT